MGWACWTCNAAAFRNNKSSISFHPEGDVIYFCSAEAQTAETGMFKQSVLCHLQEVLGLFIEDYARTVGLIFYLADGKWKKST